MKMGFLGLGKRSNQHSSTPVSDNPSLMKYLQTDPEVREILTSKGCCLDKLTYVTGSSYRFAVRTYSIEDSAEQVVEIGEIRQDEYRIVRRE